MKLKAYFLVASVLLSGVSAVGIQDAKPVEGINPGDLAPRIEINGNGSEIPNPVRVTSYSGTK